MPVMNVIKVQELFLPSGPPRVAMLCMRPTKTPFNWGRPQHSQSIAEYVVTVGSARVCVCTCAWVCVRICRWPALCLRLQEAQAFRAQNAPIHSVVSRVDPKASCFCPLQTLLAVPAVFYHIRWYQKPLRCLLQEPQLIGTWGWGRSCLPWDTDQR